MTELRRAAAEIRQLNETLEETVAQRTRALGEANRELEAFSYSVSHDLRAPLRAISGFSALLARRPGIAADAEGTDYALREEPLIEIDASRSGDETVVRVKDNGIGFDMQYAAKVFGVFERLHADGEFEGTGIGLASAQRNVHRHGGRIWCEAAPGAGACFHFSLPDRPLPEARSPAA